jgi:thiamine biosynthesis lipoprotein
LNAASGHRVPVDLETFDLVAAAVAAWCDTAHHVDPTVLDALEAAGYDRSFDGMRLDPPSTTRPHRPAPGCADVELDAEHLTVRLPRGVRLDLGGIAKGRTADLIATELVHGGARSAMVNLGGDLRVAGELPTSAAFPIAVEDPVDLTMAATTVHLADGALATSSRARRRWTVDGVEQHHLIDPATGAPCRRDVLATTVIAPTCTSAEVLAKAVVVAGRPGGEALLLDAGVAALVITEDGRRHRIGGFEAYER